MGVIDSGELLLACGAAGAELAGGLAGVCSVSVVSRPGKDLVDPLLARHSPERLIVAGTDADLAAVVVRLLRTERLGSVAVGYLPVAADSSVAATWDLPTDPTRAAEVALHGEAEPVPLVRDDSGGVLLGRGELGPVRGVAYCDDQLVLRGQARRLTVTPDPSGVATTVVQLGLLGRRTRSATGRAVQIGCVPVRVTSDGVTSDRPVTRWTWYRHTSDWRLVRGVV